MENTTQTKIKNTTGRVVGFRLSDDVHQDLRRITSEEFMTVSAFAKKATMKLYAEMKRKEELRKKPRKRRDETLSPVSSSTQEDAETDN